MRVKNLLAVVLTTSLLTGCRPKSIDDCLGPQVYIPEEYTEISDGEPLISTWWEVFQDDTLNELIDAALGQNFGVKQAYDRLNQALAAMGIAGAPLHPNAEILGTYGFEHERKEDGDTLKTRNTSTYLLQGRLGYEIDLWKRLDSLYRAEKWNACASLEDLEETAWLLTGSVTDLWLSLHEQLGLEEVIKEQIGVGSTFTRLIDLRFSVGDSSALDVYQQRLLFEGTKAALPPVLQNYHIFENQMYILLGLVPHTCTFIDIHPYRVKMPPMPDLGRPEDLLFRRPDLRAEYRRLVASDYLVAAAIAELFPKLNLNFTLRTDSKSLSELFDRQLFRIASDLLQPLLDGGRRRYEVDRRKAQLLEKLHRLSDRFIKAVQEVDDALVVEKYGRQLLELVEIQIEIAEKNVSQATIRYANGLNDYLTVIVAVQRLQTLQRQRVSESIKLLKARAKLYRALGGTEITRQLCGGGTCRE